MPDPDGYTQMDGPEEATRESAWPGTTQWPRKRGHSRVSAAIQITVTFSFFWESRTGTLLLPSPINTPAEQQRRAYSTEGRTEINLGFFRL